MKVHIKNNDGKENVVNIPLWLLGIGNGKWITKLINSSTTHNKNIAEKCSENNWEGALESLKFIQEMDKKQLKKCISILDEYKGLKVVEIKSNHGTYVKVVI
ncbi:hypothetical protein [Clostridium sp. KNHs214]|uniref:hypothetical protein n=1 Tax=Clostridium sp. KNHs214 TaxID=1540257 RepID=UPI000550F840|nr:hypothetical protein [Clostridium sp. KNHs214]